jgi:hypothetical protein
MAKAKQARTASEPKQLKLVCKCGSCTHWEILLHRSAKKGSIFENGHESLVCVNCGLEVNVYFSIGAHEGLHYERHVKGDEKEACTLSVAEQSANVRRNARAR